MLRPHQPTSREPFAPAGPTCAQHYREGDYVNIQNGQDDPLMVVGFVAFGAGGIIAAIGGGQVNLGSGNTNVGRDHVVVTLAGDVDALGAALRDLPLTSAQRAEAHQALDAFRSSTRDKPAAGEHLKRFTKVLRDAGALAAAGATVIEPLGRIARWLGPLGTAVLALL